MTKTTNNTPAIQVNGKAFECSKTGNRFIVRGVALSASAVYSMTKGVLSEKPVLEIDDILADQNHDFMKNTIMPALNDLNINCVRVYQVDPNNSHAKTMQALSDAGIYVMVGLATATYSVKQMTGEYGYGAFYHAARVVDEFQAYSNTLCFSVGNEVEFPGQQAANLKKAKKGASDATIVADTVALELKVAQAMKSFARDIKGHISTKGYRSIPVGAARQDGPQSSWESTNPHAYQVGLIGTDTIAQYYAAGDASDRMDFVAINSYRYASGGPMAAYDGLATETSALPVPVFLSETGAVVGSPPSAARDWKIVPEMYSRSELYPQLSGQIAFQLLEEGAYYGLYSVQKATDGSLSLAASPYGGLTALQTEYAAAMALPVNAAATTPVAPTTAPATAGSNPQITPAWPTGLLPQKTFKAPDAEISIENSAAYEIQITQMGMVMGTVAAGSLQSPTPGSMKVISGIALSIQANNGGNWDAVCGVAAPNVQSGITVKTDVAWGAYTGCNVDLATPISINVVNYAPDAMEVLVDGTSVGSVSATPKGDTPTPQAVSLSKVGVLCLQYRPGGGAASQNVCYFPGTLITDGVTIANDVSWGDGCNLPVPNGVTITVVNSVDQEMQIVQSGWPVATLAAANGSDTSKTLTLPNVNDIYLQIKESKTDWETVCKVPAAALQNGMTIRNDVSQYGGMCPLSFPNS